MSTDETPDAVEEERELRERERAAKERDPHEREPERSGDPLDEETDEPKPAPPGPEAQQPRG